MKEKILEILNDVVGDQIDYENETALIDKGLLSSLDIIQLIVNIGDELDVEIPATEIVPKNFNSVDALAALVERLSEE